MITIERLGTGTTDMLEYAKRAKLPAPEFIQDEMFRTIIYRSETAEKMSEKIILLIKEDPSISASEIAERIGKTPRTVERKISELKQMNILKRIGSPKGGHWEIIEENEK